jgi:hypothetical protein
LARVGWRELVGSWKFVADWYSSVDNLPERRQSGRLHCFAMNKPEITEFCFFVDERIKHKCLNGKKVADLLGYSDQGLYNWIKHNRWPTHIFQGLCAILDVEFKILKKKSVCVTVDGVAKEFAIEEHFVSSKSNQASNGSSEFTPDEKATDSCNPSSDITTPTSSTGTIVGSKAIFAEIPFDEWEEMGEEDKAQVRKKLRRLVDMAGPMKVFIVISPRDNSK